jgi:uncharacterized damage-inducible protein DinB
MSSSSPAPSAPPFGGTYAHLMAEYNAWMNGKTYAACATLSDEERKRDRGAFFRSIHATLDHLVWGDRSWMNRLAGTTHDLGPFGVVTTPDWGELWNARRALDAEILAWASALSPEWLAEPMTWSSRVYAFTQTHPRWVQVVQMFNHQTHHRGQVHAMLTAAGVDVGPTDVPMLPVLLGREH